MPAGKSPTQKMSDLAASFVAKQKGNWNHEDWEQIVSQVSAIGFEMDDEARRNLGNVVEGLKYFYRTAPKPARKKPASKKRAADKE